ncbi:MAG: helix-turn-helix transcriptional regulator [Legionella longbeachae]|nr:helix-turn-helix transcriptional regulator [Legionella longbeachae]
MSNYFNKFKIPIICANESGRILEGGVYISKVLESCYSEYAIMNPLLSKAGKRFGLNYGKNSLHIMERETDCQHLYTFHFDLEENNFLHWSLNNGQFIHDLIEEYKLKGKDLILEGKAKKNVSKRLDLQEYQGRSSYQPFTKKLLKLCHKDSNVDIFLSPQQSRCLLLLSEGQSLKGIAHKLNISARTVETHLEKVRRMLGCSTGKELISMYYETIKQFKFQNREV